MPLCLCDLESSKYSSRFDRDCCYKFLWNLEDVEKILSSFQYGRYHTKEVSSIGLSI